MSVYDEICRLIAAHPQQQISFRDYMQMCLYHPTFGYYRSTRTKIGKDGDFYTSAGLGGLLAETIVRFLLGANNRFVNLEQPLCIVEWGGGTGQFAKQFLDEMQVKAPHLYERLEFEMIESSEHHQAVQQQTLASHANRLRWLSDEQWLAQPPKANLFLFSNELLDAFAVHRVVKRDGKCFEIMVALEQGKLVERYGELTQNSELADYVRIWYPDLKNGQHVEVNLQALQWLRQVVTRIQSGAIMTIDYGDVAAELSAEHRSAGTLLCYYRHTANDEPYERVGEQDMTAHVNFSALMAEGTRLGLHYLPLQTQRQFLTDNGLLDQLQETLHIRDPFHPLVKRNRFIRQLLLSDQMSELFKVLVQYK